MKFISTIKLMLVAVITAATFLASAAQAHRVKTCVTKVDWKTDGQMQITHRVHFHDAQQILATLTDDKSENLFDIKGIARMALYMDGDFELTAESGKKVVFTPIGGEVEGDYLFIYLESAAPVQGTGFTVRSDIYRKNFDKQVNHIITERNRDEKSVILIKKNQKKTVQF